MWSKIHMGDDNALINLTTTPYKRVIIPGFFLGPNISFNKSKYQ